ncbi:helix-turn-helix domain-containing protein [Urbifossiella limnaea]|uniref:Uncharacterized protein n=1 Tax=Urbifossiella limnaea TaxID=2528023 RepID=A0A517Y1V0_9BACT|nr:helix-turn-helix domain-containing protein [Urbifossiella limnaea]QDU23753.1 hypothetical protein ETAA1_57600 [Urbifossiella limnaea]
MPTDPEAVVRDPAVRALIRIHAARVARAVPPRVADRDDVAQHLTAVLLAGLPAYDPARLPLVEFARVVVGRGAAGLVRRHRAARRNPAREAAVDVAGAADHRGRGPAGADLAADVADLLAALPPPLRAAAEAVMAARNIADAARTLGVHRTTLSERLRVVRARHARPGLAGYLPGHAVG